MKTIVLASRNPVKAKAALRGFKKMFPGESFYLKPISAPSGVADQPHCDAEAYQGALNRARNASRLVPRADYWVGIEGGIEENGHDMLAFAWIVVRSGELEGRGRTGTFFLPEEVVRLIREGRELGEADDIVFGRKNSKQEDGAIGLLTGNVIDRAELYEHAMILALVPFRNEELYT
jgi:inosine/xanthosine triphosphatase